MFSVIILLQLWQTEMIMVSQFNLLISKESKDQKKKPVALKE